MKKEIITRLLKDGHINFDEAMELMKLDKIVHIEHVPVNTTPFIYPTKYPFDHPYTITCETKKFN